MIHQSIRIPLAFAPQILNQIGNVESGLEFVDLNKHLIDTKKPYYSLLSRCEELEKSFEKFEDICNKKCVYIHKYKSFDLFNTHLEKDIATREKESRSAYFDLIEAEIKEDEKKIDEELRSNDELRQDYLKLLEEKQIVSILNAMFHQGEIKKIESKDNESETSLNYIAGICNTLNEIKIKRMIFRISKGRAIPGFFKINLDKIKEYTSTYTKANTNVSVDRKMFFIIIQGNYLKTKVTNLLNIFNCHIYNIPNPEEIRNILERTDKELAIKERLISACDKRLIQLLTSKASALNDLVSLYSLYKNYVRKEKLIYNTLNKCIIQSNFINGEVWIPEDKYDLIQNELQKLYKTNEQILPTGFIPLDIIDEKPPTYFKNNDFIFPFQTITNTYGIPRYKEINPGLFSIITFPFLFGIMFGDIGHGLILFLSAAYLCLYKDDLIKSNPLLKQMLKSRYILLLMGFFAFYCGFMYNDFMSLPTSFFNSCYTTDSNTSITTLTHKGCVYPIGIDPKWYSAKNELAFANSFKMKWSVIVGVLQITFGIILRGMNNVYFKDKLGLIFEFIPQLIFFSSIFGYMIVLIYIKWATDWTNRENMAPSIISTLMGMVLKNGSVDNKPLWANSIPIEEQTNRYLLYIAVLCVPIILIPKPLIKIFSIGKEGKENKMTKVDDNNNGNSNSKDNIEEPLLVHQHQVNKERPKETNRHEESASDILVEQCIATIEFVLGTISSTASYLRLWALSLAHAQLSHVFFSKALLVCAEMDSVLLIIIGFFVFANLTVFVLMGMDLMEASLHTLRLHWVEFQNKFYYADGEQYHPLCFRQLIEDD